MSKEALFQRKTPYLIMEGAFTRLFQTSSVVSETSTDPKKAGSEVGPVKRKTVPPLDGSDRRLPSSPRGVPTALDKKFLVWSGVFKSADQIPKSLEGEVIHRARSWGRIRMNIGFLFIVAGMGGVMIYSGKQAAKRGESLEQQNLEWHRKINEEHNRQQGNQK
ncbi:hypothetical protein Ocin01_08560 [Orchesella cincta]|uniref:Uncharacterized protein n=1 Tax=Orchesella cincta TaxID=48709 RepID=A0A1D2MYW6_ORCCI|nr:hypothetical protein Ocin01_08560 [Orchesella cincta]